MPDVRNTPGDRAGACRLPQPATPRRDARGALAAAALVMLGAGCATRAPARVAEIPFQCEDGRRFTAVFTRNPDLAVVRLQGSELSLPGTASGPGGTPARYGDGRNALYGSGGEATLEVEGLPPSRGCARVADAPERRPKAKVAR